MNNNFWGSDDSNNISEGEEFFTALVQKALTQKNSDFDFIRSWSHRVAVKTYLAGIQSVITAFAKLVDSTYETYITQVNSNTQDLQLILALKQFKQCLDYYNKEADIVYDMLDEYWSYIWSGHILDTLVGKLRSEEDLVDHREFWNGK